MPLFLKGFNVLIHLTFHLSEGFNELVDSYNLPANYLSN